MRRVSILGLVLSCGAAVVVASNEAAAPTRLAPAGSRPNVIVIMTDDLDAKSLGRLVAAGLMPNLKNSVISRGITFTNSFVSDSLCCPSRATYLTGLYAHNHMVLSNYPPEGSVRAFDDTNTLATWLHDGGYRTASIGKYLNGYGRVDVNRDGVLDIKDKEYVPPGWDNWQALLDPTTYWMYSYTINDNGTLVSYGTSDQDYQTDVLASRAAAFIADTASASPGVPFFLSITPLAPHVEVGPNSVFDDWSDFFKASIRPAPRHIGTVPAPLQRPPSFNEADVSGKPAWLQERPLMTDSDIAALQSKYENRLSAMRAVDDLIGTVVAALQQTGVFDQTAIIFTSDNGYMLGEHRLTEKLVAYEESLRVPLVISAPGYPTNEARRQLAVNTDLAPTIAALAGVSPGLQVDGGSLLPLMGNGALSGRKRFLVEHWPASKKPDFDVPEYFALRVAGTQLAANQLYVEYTDPGQAGEFYDMRIDPNQLVNLFTDTSSNRTYQRSVHTQFLAALKTCKNGSCQTIEFR